MDSKQSFVLNDHILVDNNGLPVSPSIFFVKTGHGSPFFFPDAFLKFKYLVHEDRSSEIVFVGMDDQLKTHLDQMFVSEKAFSEVLTKWFGNLSNGEKIFFTLDQSLPPKAFFVKSTTEPEKEIKIIDAVKTVLTTPLKFS